MDAENLQSDLSRVVQRHGYEKDRCAQLVARLNQIEKDKTVLVKAVGLIDGTIAVVSANGIGKIESIVTGGMRLAFCDEALGLAVIKKEGKRGNVYDLEGYRGEVHGPLMDTFGGGIVNVVGFLLRVIMIKRFKLAKVLIADEAFNNVHKRFLPMLSRLLRDLTVNHGYTIFAITHQQTLAAAADNLYELVPITGAPPKLLRNDYASLTT